MPLIGAHVSAAGGLYNAFENASRIGAQAIQIFGSSPRQWAVRLPSKEHVATFCASWKKSEVQEVYLHAPYLINIADPEREARKKSIEALAAHLAIAEEISANGLIFHIGSSKGTSKELAIEGIVNAMIEVLERVSGKTQLILENSAGGGDKIASTPLEIGSILALLSSDRVKVCIDTAHAFEAGIIESYTAANIKKMFDEFDQAFGCDKIIAFHINDSKTAFNSHHDRHENIGQGHIGLDGFKNLAREKRALNKAWLLEVPGFDNAGPDKKNIDLLRSCF